MQDAYPSHDPHMDETDRKALKDIIEAYISKPYGESKPNTSRKSSTSVVTDTMVKHPIHSNAMTEDEKQFLTSFDTQHTQTDFETSTHETQTEFESHNQHTQTDEFISKREHELATEALTLRNKLFELEASTSNLGVTYKSQFESEQKKLLEIIEQLKLKYDMEKQSRHHLTITSQETQLQLEQRISNLLAEGESIAHKNRLLIEASLTDELSGNQLQNQINQLLLEGTSITKQNQLLLESAQHAQNREQYEREEKERLIREQKELAALLKMYKDKMDQQQLLIEHVPLEQQAARLAIEFPHGRIPQAPAPSAPQPSERPPTPPRPPPKPNTSAQEPAPKKRTSPVNINLGTATDFSAGPSSSSKKPVNTKNPHMGAKRVKQRLTNAEDLKARKDIIRLEGQLKKSQRLSDNGATQGERDAASRKVLGLEDKIARIAATRKYGK
jgi:hypothetical protein